MDEKEKALRDEAVKEVEQEKEETIRSLQETARKYWDAIKEEVLQEVKDEKEKQKPVDPYQAIADKYNNRH